MSDKKKNLLIGVFFLLFGAFIYWKSLSIKHMMQNDVGSAFFPQVVAVLMMALAVARLVLALKEADVAPKKKDSDMFGGWVTIALVCGYCAIFKSVGFIISTFLFLLAEIFVLTPKEKRSYPILIAISVIAPIAIYALFVYAINQPLPKGLFGF